MAFDESLADRIRKGLGRKKNIEEKKMFGGLGFLLNGNMLAANPHTHPGRAERSSFSSRPVKKVRHQGKPMNGWVMIEPEEDDDQLTGWIERGNEFREDVASEMSFVEDGALAGVWKDRLIARLGPDEGEGAAAKPHVRREMKTAQ